MVLVRDDPLSVSFSQSDRQAERQFVIVACFLSASARMTAAANATSAPTVTCMLTISKPCDHVAGDAADGELAALFHEHSLEEIVSEPLTIDTRFSSFDDYWLPFLQQQGPAGACAASLPATDAEQLRLRLRHRLLGDDPDAPIVLRARAWAVRGTVPR